MTTSDSRVEEPASGAEWIVRQVYAAFGSTDPEVIEKAVRRHFADDCVVHEAESLPWGGRYEGVEAVAAMTVGLADPSAPIDAANLVIEDMIVRDSGSAGPSQVIAAVAFPWRGAQTVQMKALEWFTVENGKVTGIRVFLWDTAAAISALGPTASAGPDTGVNPPLNPR